jgi:hypothetical protein
MGQPVWQFAVMKEASMRAVEKKLAGGGLRPFVRTLARADQSGSRSRSSSGTSQRARRDRRDSHHLHADRGS